jgi:hypothetical protein
MKGMLSLNTDVYHVWWDPKLEQQIKRAGKRILAYHPGSKARDTRASTRSRPSPSSTGGSAIPMRFFVSARKGI